jgi:hypothetical protein
MMSYRSDGTSWLQSLSSCVGCCESNLIGDDETGDCRRAIFLGIAIRHENYSLYFSWDQIRL